MRASGFELILLVVEGGQQLPVFSPTTMSLAVYRNAGMFLVLPIRII